MKKRMFEKILAGLLAVAMTVTGYSGNIYALEILDETIAEDRLVENNTDEYSMGYVDLSDRLIQSGGFPTERDELVNDKALAASDLSGATNAIYEGLKAKNTSINVSEYGINVTDVEDVFFSVVNSHPELFYCKTGYEYEYYGTKAITIIPMYTGTYTDSDIVKFENKVTEIISGLDNSWSDTEKALYLHDYLVTHCSYDKTYTRYDAYDALVVGSAVCQGYSLAYEHLLQKAGIDGQVVTSDYNKHAWNLVKIDGKWYYTDCTNDDPTFSDGKIHSDYCDHENLLRSRSEFAKLNNHASSDWIGGETRENVYSKVSTDSKYDSYFWSNSKAAIAKAGRIAFDSTKRKTTTLTVHDFSNDSEKTYSLNSEENWTVPNSNSYYPGNYVSFTVLGNTIYYSTVYSIYRLDNDGVSTLVYTLTDAEKQKGCIYGLTPSGDSIVYSLYITPNDTAAAATGTWKSDIEIPKEATKPTISKQPALSLNLKYGDTTGNTLSIAATAASGHTLSYQWYSNTSNNTSGTAISGAKSSSYTVPTSALGTKYYYCVVTAERTDNHATASVTSSISTVNVARRPVTVTADNKSKAEGAADPEFTATVTGLLGSDKVTYTLSREKSGTTQGEKPGTYVITPSGSAEQGNYTVTYVPGTLTITEKENTEATEPTITKQPATTLGLVYGDTTENTLSITATSASGHTLSYQWYSNTSKNTSGTVISGATASSYTVPASAIGTKYYYCVVTAERTDNHATASVTSSICTVNIARRPVTVTADNKSKVAGAADPELTATVTGLLGTDKVTYTLSREKSGTTQGEKPGTYAITPLGSAEQGNYTVTYVPGKLTITDVEKTSIEGAVVELGTALTYTGSEQTQSVSSVKLEGVEIKDSCVISNNKGTDAGNYTLKVTAKEDSIYTGEVVKQFTIAKADHENASTAVSAKFGSTGTINLSSLVEQGGQIYKEGITVSDTNGVLKAKPDVTDKVLSFEIKANSALVDKKAQVTVPVKDSKNYKDYNIVVTITVTDCKHEHTEKRDEKKATCEEDGYSGDVYCLDCQQIIEKGHKIDMLGHDWDGGIVTTEATIYSKGVKIYTCRRCGATRTELIPMKEKSETAEEESINEDAKDENGKSAVKVETVENSGKDNKQTITTVTIAGEEVSRTVADENGETSEITRIWIGGVKSSYSYTGSAITPQINVYDGVKKLTEKKDYKVKYSNNKNTGEARIAVNFIGNYAGTGAEDVYFDIVEASLENDFTVMDTAVQVKGKEGNEKVQKVIPKVVSKVTGKELSSKMLDVSYKYLAGGSEEECDGVSVPGTYKAVIRSNSSDLKGTCEGIITVVSRENTGRNLAKGKISIAKSAKSKLWTGKEIELTYGTDFTVTDSAKNKVPSEDIEVSYIDNKEPGTAYILINAKDGNEGGYVGSLKGSFKIVKGREIKKEDGFTINWDKTVSYEKGGVVPNIVIKDGESILQEGRDYTVKYKGNKSANESAEATVKGKGLYKGTVSLPFKIEKQYIGAAGIVIYASDIANTKKDFTKVSITVIDRNGKKLGKSDYELDPNSMIELDGDGNCKATIKGKGNYTGKTTVTYKYMDGMPLISDASVDYELDPKDYTGSPVTLTKSDLKGVLSYDGWDLMPGVDFKVIAYSNNVNKGTATVTLKGINNFGGTRTLNFKIISKDGDYKGSYSDGKWNL